MRRTRSIRRSLGHVAVVALFLAGTAQSQVPDRGPAADCNGNQIPDETEFQITYVSPILSPIHGAAPQDFVIRSAATATGEVRLRFEGSSDLNSAPEFIDVDLNGTLIGSVFTSGASACSDPPDSDVLQLAAVEFNGLVNGGDATIHMQPTVAVDSFCDPSFIRVTARYLSTEFVSASEELSPLESGAPTSHTVSPASIASGDVTLAFDAIGDLDLPGENVAVDISGVPIGIIFDTGGSNCPAAPETDQLVVPAATYNAALIDRTAVINMVPGIEVGVECGSSMISVTVRHSATMDDCNGNAILDACDIAGATSQDCNDDGRPDSCEIDTDGDALIDECDACPDEPGLTMPDEPGREVTCDDAVDNDCDGLTDLDDPNCLEPVCLFTCGDISGDLAVDLVDFLAFAGCFGQAPSSSQTCTCADHNGDQSVDLNDFLLFAALIGIGSTASPPNCL